MSTALYKGKKYQQGVYQWVEDVLTVEESLKITINSAPFTVTMRTPGHEEELVRGLLFTENIYAGPSGPVNMEVKAKSADGFVTWIDVKIPPAEIGKGIENTRSIVSVSSCGICGKSELETLRTDGKNLETTRRIAPEVVTRMFSQMSELQATFHQSGGSHASAAFTEEGRMLTIQEDIGRHNAVDKVIGSLLLENRLRDAACLIVSGRISYEIVSKCSIAGIPFLAAVSAPSSMAVEMSDKLGITLLAFCRGDKLTAYSHTARLLENISAKSVPV